LEGQKVCEWKEQLDGTWKGRTQNEQCYPYECDTATDPMQAAVGDVTFIQYPEQKMPETWSPFVVQVSTKDPSQGIAA
jgi:hypothetical protein